MTRMKLSKLAKASSFKLNKVVLCLYGLHKKRIDNDLLLCEKGRRPFSLYDSAEEAKSVRFKKNSGTLALRSLLYVAGWFQHCFVCFSKPWSLFISTVASTAFVQRFTAIGLCFFRLSLSLKTWKVKRKRESLQVFADFSCHRKLLLCGGGDRSLHGGWTFPFVRARASEDCVRHAGLLCPLSCFKPRHYNELFFAYFMRRCEMAVRLFIAPSRSDISPPVVSQKKRKVKSPDWQSWRFPLSKKVLCVTAQRCGRKGENVVSFSSDFICFSYFTMVMERFRLLSKRTWVILVWNSCVVMAGMLALFVVRDGV